MPALSGTATGAAPVPDEPRPVGPRGLGLAAPNLIASVVLLLANLGSGILTARLLGPQGRGLVTASTTLLLGFSTLGLIGLRDAVIYAQARQRHPARVLLGTSLQLAALLAVPVTAVAVLAAVGIFAHQGHQARDVAVLAALFCPVVMVQQLVSAIAAGRQRYVLLAMCLAGQSVLYTAAVVGLRLARSLSPAHVVLSFGAAFLPALLVVLLALVREGRPGRLHRALAGELLRYGVRAQVGTIGDVANARLDLTLMPAFVLAASVGQYAVAVSVASLITVLFGALGPVVLSAAAARDSLEVVVRATRSVLSAATVLAFGLAATAWFLIRVVYGGAYGQAYVLMLLLLPGIVAWSTNYSVVAGLQSIGRPGLASRAQTYGLVVTLVGLSALLPTVGAPGAALTSSVAYVVVLTTAGRQLERAGHISLWAQVFDGRALVGDVREALAAVGRRRSRRG